MHVYLTKETKQHPLKKQQDIKNEYDLIYFFNKLMIGSVKDNYYVDVTFQVG